MRDVPLTERDTPCDADGERKLRERLRAAKDVPWRSDPATERELRKVVLRELDQRVLDTIERRFGKHIPEGRLEQARAHSTEFLRKGEYERLLRETYGLSPSQAAQVLGHFDRTQNKTWVCDAWPLTLKRVAHERLHQLADPKAEAVLGEPLYEGVTQVLSVEAMGDPHLKDDPSVYPREMRVVEMLRALAGTDAVERAYFTGDVASVRTRVDDRLGEGAFAEIVQLTRLGRWAEVDQLVRERATGGMAG